MEASKKRSRAELAKTANYEIQIAGILHERWSHWFSGIMITIEQQEDRAPRTVLLCPAIDQARLRGLLNMIWDLNLDLLAVRRLPPGAVRTELREV